MSADEVELGICDSIVFDLSISGKSSTQAAGEVRFRSNRLQERIKYSEIIQLYLSGSVVVDRAAEVQSTAEIEGVVRIETDMHGFNRRFLLLGFGFQIEILHR